MPSEEEMIKRQEEAMTPEQLEAQKKARAELMKAFKEHQEAVESQKVHK